MSLSLPLFANPAGFWALAGIPAILAIHFLQQRSRVVRTSTWFLIEKLAPDSVRGRTWDRLRSSRTLWLQLAAVLVASWLLAEPRWVRSESAQTVVIVLDASISMDAFRDRAMAAAEREVNLAEGLAARTTWVVMTTNPRQPALYRGTDRTAAMAALTRWQPELGRHDVAPALRLARGLAGASGRTLLVTDSRAKVPPDQRAAGVGRVIDNVGFAGASVTRDENGAYVWRALVKNHAPTPQQRTWAVEAGGARTAEQALSLAPGALTEISARFPDNADQLMVVLSADGFSADDRLPLVRPKAKPITVAIDGTEETAEYFRKIAASVEGVTIVGPNQNATLRMGRMAVADLAKERHGGIFWPPADQRAQAPLAADPITPDRDPLVAGLNWQGWFGTGTYGFTSTPGDTVLLWQGRWPLVFLRPPPANLPPSVGRKLVLAFDWATSNAARLPATVLLARRFLEAERDAQPAAYAANFDCGALVPITGVDLAVTAPDSAGGTATAFTLGLQPAAGGAQESRPIGAGELNGLRAPSRSGFFTVRRGEELIVRGTAQFADTRMGDFRAAETFFVTVGSERTAAIERNTTPDPFVPLWLVLLAALALGSWWVKGSSGTAKGSGPARDAVAAKPKAAAAPVMHA